MKKLILSFCICFSVQTQAQTLTQAFNEPVVGDNQQMVRLDTSLFVPVKTLSISGQNVSWDFSSLHTASDPLISSFISTVAVASASDYAGCNLIQDDNGSYTYLKSVTTPTTRTELLGLNLQGSVVTLTNSAIVANYPISYGSTFTDNASGTAVFTGSTLPVSGKMSYTADATGTLTLADGFVYKNVIRIKSIQTFTATYLFLPLVTVARTTYDFYDASLKFQVLSVTYQNMNVFGQASTSGSYAGNAGSFTGISKHSELNSAVSILPNPSTGVFVIKGNDFKNYTMRVMDATGKVILADTKTLEANGIEINLSNYPSGLYFLNLSNGTEQAQFKLLKN